MKRSLLLPSATLAAIVLFLGACAAPAPAPAQPPSPGAPAPTSTSAPAPTSAPSPKPVPSATATQQTITLKYASSSTSATIVSGSSIWWLQEVEKRTNGRVKFESYFGGVTKPGEELDAVRTGVLDLATINYSYYPDRLPLVSIGIGAPFGPYDMDTQRKLWETMFQDPTILNDVERYNVKVLALFPVLDYAMGAKQPVLKLEDFKGRKTASVGTSMATILKAAGATPVTVPAPERYMSLQTGVIDSHIISFEAHAGFKTYEVAPYITRLGGVVTTMSGDVTINKDTFNKLPADIQKIFVDTGKDADVFNVQAMNKASSETEQTIVAGKGKVYDLPAEERQKWAKLLPNMHQDWATQMNAKGLPGTQVMKLYKDTLVKVGYQFPVDWPVK